MSGAAREASGEIVPVRLPDAGPLFARRADRLEALSHGHAAEPYLAFLARLARAQAVAVREVRGGGWRELLAVVLGGMRGAALPEPARAAVARLQSASAAQLEALAGDLLSGRTQDLAAAPFVGAGLQVYWTRHAGALDPRGVPSMESGCPVCGSGPVAAVVLGVERLRYLVCALCATEWHLPRVQCAGCRATDRVSYLALDGAGQRAPPAVRAEACDACRGYVKLVDLERLPAAEATADDAATLVLDLLVAERGYRRVGQNLLAPSGGREG